MRKILSIAAVAWFAAAGAPTGAQPGDIQSTLAGSAWELVEWNGLADKFARAPNLVFGPGETISGWGSCNLSDSKFGADLKRIVRFELGAGDTLVARDSADGVVFRFRRAKAEPAR